jgi:predicted dehydrogenase
MAWADIEALTASPHVKLVAVAEVDQSKLKDVREKHRDVRIYADGRDLLDKEKELDSVNVSTPDHMHALFALRSIERGLHVYCQKPLTHTLYEARVLTEKAASSKQLVTQMGIQIHAHEYHRMVVRLIHDGHIGKVKQVHSWCGKGWGDRGPRPNRADPVPQGFDWNLWLGGAAERPFVAGYYHPFVWRKRLDFGTGTFGDMACHILDPVFTSLSLTVPMAVQSDGPAPGPDSWDPDVQVSFDFPGTERTAGSIKIHWYNGSRRPAADVLTHLENQKAWDSGTIYLGEKGVLYSPYIGRPVLLPVKDFRDFDYPKVGNENHYLQFVDACCGRGKTATPFSYAGPLTEVVLLGCLATHFPSQKLEWDAARLKVTNHPAANNYLTTNYRRGWEVK